MVSHHQGQAHYLQCELQVLIALRISLFHAIPCSPCPSNNGIFSTPLSTFFGSEPVTCQTMFQAHEIAQNSFPPSQSLQARTWMQPAPCCRGRGHHTAHNLPPSPHPHPTCCWAKDHFFLRPQIKGVRVTLPNMSSPFAIKILTEFQRFIQKTRE